MGCDIHLYVEYKYKSEYIQIEHWNNFGEHFNLDRNYSMFGILAHVRRDPILFFEQKGLPEKLAYHTSKNLYVDIFDPSDNEHETDSNVTLEIALDWNERLGCEIKYDHNKKPSKIQNPDDHSYSYLSLKEYEQALIYYKNHNDSSIIEYEAILAVMTSLEKEGANETRIVFWFDN